MKEIYEKEFILNCENQFPNESGCFGYEIDGYIFRRLIIKFSKELLNSQIPPKTNEVKK